MNIITPFSALYVKNNNTKLSLLQQKDIKGFKEVKEAALITNILNAAKNKLPLTLKYTKDVTPSVFIQSFTQQSINSLTPDTRKVLEFVVTKKLRYRMCYMRQDTIAEKLNMSRGHVNRCISLLAELGFISKIFRGVKRTCLYGMSSYFNQKENRAKLIHFLKPMALFSVALLTVLGISFNTLPIGNVTQHRKRVMDITNKYNIFHHHVDYFQKKYNLAPHAVYKLCIFPPEALDFVREEEKKLFKIKDPLSYLIHQLKTYCHRKELKPNWARYYHLMEVNKLDKEAPHYLDRVSVIGDFNKNTQGISAMDALKPRNSRIHREIEKEVAKESAISETIKSKYIPTPSSAPVITKEQMIDEMLKCATIIDNLKDDPWNTRAWMMKRIEHMKTQILELDTHSV